MTNHLSFPSIGGLHNIVDLYDRYPFIFPETMVYRGKPKLHGGNVAIRIDADGTITGQSRSTDLTETTDYHGFVKWIAANRDYFASLRQDRDFVIFGEWAGSGIQKGTSLNLLDHKLFAVFLIMFPIKEMTTEQAALADAAGLNIDSFAEIVTEPAEIAAILDRPVMPEHLYVLPWWGQTLTVKFADRETLQAAAQIANDEIAIFEVCDPYVKETFGVEGNGEGVVYYPVGVDNAHRFGDFAFKAKGGKHKVKGTKKAVEVDPEVLASIAEFVEVFVTQARLDQGLETLGGKARVEETGDFLAWLCRDIEKESKMEIEVADLEWKMVAKAISAKARPWFLTLAKTI
jgi:hypothetical protein